MRPGIARLWLLTLVFLHGALALAEPCGDPIRTQASDGLNAVADRDCDFYWSGRLPQSNTLATVAIDTDIDDITDSVKAAVVVGLRDADGALVKLGSNPMLEGRNKPVGRAVRVIVTSLTTPNAFAFAEMHSTGCFIVIDPSSWRTERGRNGLLITMAHEFFHCIQNATLPGALRSPDGPGDAADSHKWWREGSAEWYGILAQPELERTGLAIGFEFFTDFLPITDFQLPGASKGQHSQGAMTWPFFAWYSERHSAHQVLPFLSDLPRGEHTPQRIVRKLNHLKWGEFATRYSAFTIWMDGVGAVDPERHFHQPVKDLDEGEHAFDRPAGHMIRERIRLEPGNWALEGLTDLNKGYMFYSRLKGNGDPDGAWLRFDQRREVRTVCGEPLDLMLAGFGSDPDSTPFELKVERIDDDCEVRCGSVPRTRAACVVGTWENREPDLEDALRRQPGVTNVKHPSPTYSFGADGRFSVNHPFYLRKDLDAPPGHTLFQITNYWVNANYGYWGTESSTLGICEQQKVSRGEQVTGADGDQAAMPLDWDKPIDPPRNTQFEFRCIEPEDDEEPDILELRTPSMGEASMRLTRVDGPVAPEEDSP